MDNKIRQKVAVQEPSERIKNFDEVSRGFDDETACVEASRCLNCKNPRCVEGCPVNINIPKFIMAIKDGNPLEAERVLKENNSLPAVCGRVCPQESQCEKYCIRQKLGGPVAIGALERYAADFAIQNSNTPQSVTEKIDLKVAVIGSGPSGLAAAGELAKNGAQVTVFEAFHKPGGVLVYGIPEFRLPKSIVEKEIGALKEMGVIFRLNTVIGKTFYLDELLDEYDYVYIGSGAGLPSFMNIKGESLPGVYTANELLTRVNLMKAYQEDSVTPVKRGKRVAVVGAGNVAMDAARTALRLGAEKVYIVYRRSRAEMPAREEEIEHAIEEGIEFILLTSPVEILGTDMVEGIKCVRMELREPDASGRRGVKPIAGSEFTIDCDEVVMSIGTSPNRLIKDTSKGLNTAKNGILTVDENGQTSIDRVYAGGDAVTGAATVILAMGAGKKAAQAMLKRHKESLL